MINGDESLAFRLVRVTLVERDVGEKREGT